MLDFGDRAIVQNDLFYGYGGSTPFHSNLFDVLVFLLNTLFLLYI